MPALKSAPIFLLLTLLSGSAGLAQQNRPARLDLNSPRQFPPIQSKAEWEQRAEAIREQVLVSCGLWPLPEKAPLQAKIFGKIEKEDYTIEKVFFQTHPGFFLAGNLYRPKGQGPGPFPAILNPHGHWDNGRMADTTNGSIAGRCISFARQGMIAFSYDMVGYNDTIPFGKNHRTFATDPTNLLWNISVMGLQTWNSVRALDFLASLPDADKSRLACTGESGGGTQTFMLGAIDSRLKAQAPVVMVSHSMQGGCVCENAPGLRVKYSNMELAAAPAPRPQILVSATGDWTRATSTVEGPAIAKIYSLFEATNQFSHLTLDYGHNYNRASREAVYQWFGRWLLGRDAASAGWKEKPFEKEPDEALRVWPDGKMPEGALSENDFIRSLVAAATKQLEDLWPRDAKSLEKFQAVMKPAWRHILQVEPDGGQFTATVNDEVKTTNFTRIDLTIYQPSHPQGLPVINFLPATGYPGMVVVMASGPMGQFDQKLQPIGMTKKLLEAGNAVLFSDFRTPRDLTNLFANYFSTYNSTPLQNRVRQLVSLCGFAKGIGKGPKVVLVGDKEMAAAVLLAAPSADGVIAGGSELPTDDAQWQMRPYFIPGIHRLGDFPGALLLATSRAVAVHGLKSSPAWSRLERTWKEVGSPAGNLQLASNVMTEEEMVAWIRSQSARK